MICTIQTIVIQYSIKGATTRKTFNCPVEAAEFFLACIRAGRSPRYV